MDPKAKQFRFYVFTRMKLGDNGMKILTDLTDVYGASCVSYICRWTEGFRAGKVSLEDGHCPSCLVLVSNEQTVLFVKKLVQEDPHVTIHEICKRFDISIGTAERSAHNDVNLRKIAQRWIPHLLTRQQKKQRVQCIKDLLKMFEPDRPKCFYSPIKYGWLLTGRDQLRYDQVSRFGNDHFPFFFQHAGFSHGRHSTVEVNIHSNILLEVIKSIHQQHWTCSSTTTLLLHANTSAPKAKVTVTFLEKQNIQVLALPVQS